VGISVLDKVKVRVDGALPLLSAICDTIGLADRIDNHVGKDQSERIVSTGTAIKALVMNIVARRRALYKLTRFYGQTDTEKLFGEGVHPENLTDDVMARSLDELFEIGAKMVLTESCMAAINEYGIPVPSVHADTTSKTLYGAYKDSVEEDDAIHITRGYNKDYRPDLKQIMFGLGVTKDRVLVLGDVMDGNTSDKEWNKDILKDLRDAMRKYGLSDFIYVADSAAVTEQTLKRLSGTDENELPITFVSRLPGNFQLEHELREKAIANPKLWEEVGTLTDKKDAAEYKTQSYTGQLYEMDYRFIVCYSNQLHSRKAKSIESHIKQEQDMALKSIRDFQRIEFYCLKDAQEAATKFEKDLALKYHELTIKIESFDRPVKRKKRGRPRKDEVPQTETIFKCAVSFYKDSVRIGECKDKESTFVLITNALDEEKMNNRFVLQEYKEQSSVESTFRVLKDPYFINELFVKTPERVEALSYVFLIALMVLTLLERTVRENLKKEDKRIIVAGNRKTFTPTGVSIIETLDQIQTLVIYDEEQDRWERHCRLTVNEKRLIRLAGFAENIYTEGFKKLG
jgi:transposase